MTSPLSHGWSKLHCTYKKLMGQYNKKPSCH